MRVTWRYSRLSYSSKKENALAKPLKGGTRRNHGGSSDVQALLGMYVPVLSRIISSCLAVLWYYGLVIH